MVALTIDFLSLPLARRLGGKTRTRRGYININCPLCQARGELRADRKRRLGVNIQANSVIFNCFNCHAAASYTLGRSMPVLIQQFMLGLGFGEREVKEIALHAERIRRLIGSQPILAQQYNIAMAPEFSGAQMPPGARTLDEWAADRCEDADYMAVLHYLLGRGDEVAATGVYYWTPQDEMNRRLIVPCHYNRRLVGWIARCIDDSRPRYLKHVPDNFLFNADALSASHRHYLFIVEGVFDAIALDGVAALGGTLNDYQLAWIKSSDKQPIMVPDRDRAGLRLIEIAVANGWAVAAPHYGGRHWWQADIKDAADAVARYGRLYTFRSVIETASSYPGIIRQRSEFLMGN